MYVINVCTNLLKFCFLIKGEAIQWTIALTHAKNSLSSPFTSLHKHQQKDTTKTLTKFTDYVSIDYGFANSSNKSLKSQTAEICMVTQQI